MPRPKKERIVSTPPLYASFKPTGVKRTLLEQVSLSLDEYEAIRLADHLHMDQKDAAQEMGISRPTFSRLIEQAHEKVASFLIEGKEMTIEGGRVHFKGNIVQCADCGCMHRIPVASSLEVCPSCGSTNLIDHAGGFGHGRCCGEYEERSKEQ
ncbi:MAG: DUF134 domain-containing protein [Spirochaetia bacterium]|jgi:uncharacterized protein|nr:DUF134 domain-containing protein [Spirochaetia bacterium]